jgi:hypothetical protein
MNAESTRLLDAKHNHAPWRMWGPYLSERQWGTVREDYSDSGAAWDYFSHDQSRSRAYRWGEDGLAGISDDRQRLCFAIALWNGKDPILKERLFGLTNSEGNHGEDCKEYYYYLDSTPTHSYMKYLYKYPQAAFPYDQLVAENRKRGRNDMEYELIDTGIFDQNRYFDVFVEYAKESPEDILVRITACNRGPEPAALWLLPTLWFRNTWGGAETSNGDTIRPMLEGASGSWNVSTVIAHQMSGDVRYLYCDNRPSLLFTDNETNNERVFGTPNASTFVKDGINRFVVDGQSGTVNPSEEGTKASAAYELSVPAGEQVVVRLRLTDLAPQMHSSYPGGDPFGSHFEEIMKLRITEADEFYTTVTPASFSADQARVYRQALAGMLWSKQYYEYDLSKWLKQHGSNPADQQPRIMRNSQWFHMVNSDIISMPDKWEYPWYAAWDLAFHTLALSIVDQDFSQDQLALVLRERYLHPNGQIPAYEWNFGDVNPPVHAWACIFNYRLQIARHGEGDRVFLKHAFNKLLMNFTWWMNQKDRSSNNIFEGGFLGLDNISIFDRAQEMPTGGYLEQADGTGWMALFAQNMLEIALELATDDPIYEEMACKFLEHFLWIAAAINKSGMWDEEDGFYYDLLRLPNGASTPLKLRTMVGLLPLCASTVFERHVANLPHFMARTEWFISQHPELFAHIRRPGPGGVHGRKLLALLDENRLRRVLARVLDETEFLSDYGIRSTSRCHREHPYIMKAGGREYRLDYEPAESSTGLFGGNSNWRGPIWMPVNALIVRALLQFSRYYGDTFTVECPTGSGQYMNLFEVEQELNRRISNIFLADHNGLRPVFGGAKKFQTDPHWRDYILFYEYFHGDNGAGLGASHQTGWTGLVARLLQMNSLDANNFFGEDVPLPQVMANALDAARAKKTNQ